MSDMIEEHESIYIFAAGVLGLVIAGFVMFASIKIDNDKNKQQVTPATTIEKSVITNG